MNEAAVSEDSCSDAFHGTSSLKGRGIIQTGFQLPSDSDDNRYGRAVYFWKGSKVQAERWARSWHKGQAVCVIKARVAFGKHLNLITPEGQTHLARVATYLNTKGQAADVSEAAALTFMANRGWIETALMLDIPRSGLITLFPHFHSPGGIRLILSVYAIDKILDKSIVMEEEAS